MKKMTSTLPIKIFALVGATTLVACAFWFGMQANHDTSLKTQAQNRIGCNNQEGVKAAIHTLSLEDPTKQKEAFDTLLGNSEASQECRSEIITLLMHAMDKPNLNFISDKPSYLLWLNGSRILGSLKAVEALDLLIDHLDLNDGLFSASYTHQPALVGVTQMGELAVPKLDLALRNNPNQRRRLAAALSLFHIGTPQAMKSLEWAVGSRSDKCVRRFAKIAVEISKLERNSNSNIPESEADTELDLRRELLIAFRCGS